MAAQDDTKKVWCCGDVCLAHWQGDRQFYKAVIKCFSVDKAGNKKALVTFAGYSSGNDELVDVNSLKVPSSPQKPPMPKSNERLLRKTAADVITLDEDTEDESGTTNIGMFSPLRGDEEQRRLREKFQELDREERPGSERGLLKTCKRRLLDEVSPAPTSSVHKKRQRVVTSARVSSRGKEMSEKGDPSPSAGRGNMQGPVIIDCDSDMPSEQTEDSKPTSFASSGSGFADEDMEKPRFSHVTPLVLKRPFLLSSEGEQPVFQIPAPINQYLRDYQRAGVSFLYNHYRQDQGCLLGDDMGLGKTVQVIALIAAVLGKTGTRHDVTQMVPRFIRMLDGDTDDMSPDDIDQKKVFLIIGPASVLFNWLSELDTWGYFGVGKYHSKYKAETVANLRRHKLDVVVTTFETCRDNIEEINSFRWEAVFADEAHKIKGLKAEVSKALRTLKCQRRFALTGTPLQNTLEELWSILDWANSGCLGTLGHFQERFVRVIERGQKQDSTKRELAEARRAQESLSRLRARWMLRRTKTIIAEELPKKRVSRSKRTDVVGLIYELVVYCRPSQLQLDIYQAILDRSDVQFIMQQNHLCDCNSGQRRVKCCHKVMPDGLYVKAVTMTFMSLLLKIANHLALLLPEFTNTKKQSAYNLAVCSHLLASHPEFLQHSHATSVSALSQPKFCGKMKVLQGLLSVFKKDHSKVLIFSYSTRLLDIIERYVISAGHVYRRLDGSTSQRRRAEVVTEFNRDQNIFLFLVSTKAGGIGLNLTGANKVVIFDPNWNPTHDLQAVDRAYRIGQQRDVHVLRLITAGTIEENIYLRQVYKQQLGNIATTGENARRYFHAIAGDRDHQGELFGIENTFRLRTGKGSVTEDIFQRNEEIEEGLRAFNVQKYVPRQDSYVSSATDASGISDIDMSDHESLNDMSSVVSSSDISSDGSESDVKPAGRCRRKQDRRPLNPRHIIDSSTCSDSAETDNESSDEVLTKQHNSPGRRDKRKYLHRRNEHSLHDSAHKTSPQPSTSHSANRNNHTALRKHTDERQGIVEGSKKLGKGKKVSWGEEDKTESQSTGSFTSISDVLQNCGVTHTHCNRELIGGSKAEDHMTRCAMEDVFEHHQGSQMPAIACDPYMESSPENEDQGPTSVEKGRKMRKGGRRKSEDKQGLLGKATKTIGKDRVLIGQTPRAICRHHLISMAASMNISDPATLAHQILTSTSEERLTLLRAFYVGQNAALEPLFTLPEKTHIPATPAPKQKVLRARRRQEPTRRGGKQGHNISTCNESKSKRRPAPRKGYIFSSSEETEESEREEDICKRTSHQRKTESSKTSTATNVVRRGMGGNRNEHDENTDTTHTDSIENLLDDVFGLSSVEENSNETLHKLDRLKQSRMLGDIAPNERRTRNMTKPNVQTTTNASTGKMNRKEKTDDVPKTPNMPQVSMKTSTRKSPVLVNPSKTVDKVKGQAKAADESVAAMLDDIFFGDGGTPTKKRKPPKHKSPRKVCQVDKSSDSMESECSTTRGFGRNVTDRNSDAESLTKCDSDVSDIFSDPQKWVQKDKRHRTVVSEKPDDACLDVDEDIYDKLLATGKLQRIKR